MDPGQKRTQLQLRIDAAARHQKGYGPGIHIMESREFPGYSRDLVPEEHAAEGWITSEDIKEHFPEEALQVTLCKQEFPYKVVEVINDSRNEGWRKRWRAKRRIYALSKEERKLTRTLIQKTLKKKGPLKLPCLEALKLLGLKSSSLENMVGHIAAHARSLQKYEKFTSTPHS